MRIISKAIGSFVFALGCGLSAQAADLPPAYKAPPPATAYNWTGFYIGGNLGYGWARASGTATVAGIASAGSENLNGAVGGAQVGYNWQTGNWVWGIESDLQVTGQRATNSGTGFGLTVSETDKLPWFGTTRLRGGFAAGPWLFYGTGGIGYGQIKSEVSFSGVLTGTANSSTTRAAWVAGAGVETAINNSNWTWRVEYLHLDSGTVSNSYTIAGVPMTTSMRLTNEVVRTALNYRF